MNAIVRELGAVLNKPPKAIEIIPGNGDEWLPEDTEPHKRFLFEEDHLGIPHKILCRAYVGATEAFRRSRALWLSDVRSPAHSSLSDELLATSAVLITLNPGHNTAWNIRKALVLARVQDASVELAFTSALLTVHECSKHSLLWHHRRWLLRSIHPLIDPLPTTAHDSSMFSSDMDDGDALQYRDISVEAYRNEFAACSLASGTYERNYFAWSHRSRCLEALAESIRRAGTLNEARTAGAFLTILQEEYDQSSQWIEQHISDYTSMQYQCRVDAILRKHSRLLPPTFSYTTAFAHARSLLQSYPDHEALWYYLRGSAVSSADGLKTAATELEELAKRYTCRDEFDNDRSWVASAEASRCANGLLAWLKLGANNQVMNRRTLR
ncbi:hypothetical protein BDW22DRAFT_1483728 [Trametopsis cervina]|nr:hypothetical protein BDW22DRAFT_1483728 [Trametopsis cervina]